MHEMPARSPKLDLLRECLIQMLSQHRSACAQDICVALSAADLTAVAPMTAEKPPMLQQAVDATDDDLRPILKDATPYLSWREGGFGKARNRGEIALWVSTLVGPTGLARRDDVTLGLILMAPTFRYPDHSHAAEELYLVLSGELGWRVDGVDIGIKRSGAIVHHLPHQRHAMTIGRQPALLFWGWTGDIRPETYRIH